MGCVLEWEPRVSLLTDCDVTSAYDFTLSSNFNVIIVELWRREWDGFEEYRFIEPLRRKVLYLLWRVVPWMRICEVNRMGIGIWLI